jgi:hypothetical protein
MSDELINNHFNSYFTSPSKLFIIRSAFLAASIVMLIWIIVTSIVVSQKPTDLVKYYTHFSWIGLVIYFIVMVFLSKRLEKMKEMSDRKKYWTAIALEALVSITQTVTWMVVLVYWILLSSKLPTLGLNSLLINVVEHSIDLVFVVVEMVLTKSWLNYYSFVFPMAIGWLYTFWTWIFVYAGIWDWPYGFFDQVLNPNNRPAWITVVAILAASLVIILIFFIVYAIFRIREYYGNNREKTQDEVKGVVVPAKEITGEFQA